MKKILLLSLLALTLSACSSVKEELGVGRHSPDEFTVVKRAPLTLPPDYALRPPSDSDTRPASEAADQARGLLMGEGKNSAVKGNAEQVLLQKMGAEAANPDIRNVINEENGYIALQNRAVADKLIFWKEGTDDEKMPAAVVDPKAEAERLKKNEAEGKPVNDGDVPTIEKKQSTIDKLF